MYSEITSLMQLIDIIDMNIFTTNTASVLETRTFC